MGRWRRGALTDEVGAQYVEDGEAGAHGGLVAPLAAGGGGGGPDPAVAVERAGAHLLVGGDDVDAGAQPRLVLLRHLRRGRAWANPRSLLGRGLVASSDTCSLAVQSKTTGRAPRDLRNAASLVLSLASPLDGSLSAASYSAMVRPFSERSCQDFPSLNEETAAIFTSRFWFFRRESLVASSCLKSSPPTTPVPTSPI